MTVGQMARMVQHAPTLRDAGMEAQLTDALARGSAVWVIGDVHGFDADLAALLSHLQLGPADQVLFLGDLIDRGPDPAAVVARVRGDDRFHCILGNHELMAIAGLREDGVLVPQPTWQFNGGSTTLESYGYHGAFLDCPPEDGPDALVEDIRWMMTLPVECVLEDWWMVHAGVDPRSDLEGQNEGTKCWIRDSFLEHGHPLDPQRTIVHGHTPTDQIEGCEEGEPAVGGGQLADGRPGRLGLDTSMFAWIPGWLCAFDLQTCRILLANREMVIESHLSEVLPEAI